MYVNENQKLILGPPGCGKTTRVLNLVSKALEQGIEPDRIAFVSFTRKAVHEATTRACSQFSLVSKDLPHFRTVHSSCFRAMKVTKQDMMDSAQYKELGDILGYRFDGTFDESETGLPVGGEKGDQLLFLDNYARITCKSLRETWEEADSGLDWYELERLSKTLALFKHQKMLFDFTDLLAMFVERGFALNVEFAVIDEAQDLSALQWRVLTTAFSKAKQVYIAGDDDQSIYKWSGADLDAFMSLEGEKEILSQSYRLPRAVHKRATEIISNVPKRFSKPFSPRDEEGEIDSLQTIDYLNINPAESTMILVRNVYLLSRVQAVLKGQGHPYLGRHGYASVKQDHVDAITCWEHLYKGREISAKRVKNMVAHMQIGRYLARGAKVKIGKEPDNKLFTWTTLVAEYGVMQYALWHEALEGIDLDTRAYYLSIMHSGRKITETPKVTIQTVHGVKGGEADHVILLPDMSKRTYEQYQKNAAEETRVAYVAVTRAKRKLSIVLPSSQRYYPY